MTLALGPVAVDWVKGPRWRSHPASDLLALAGAAKWTYSDYAHLGLEASIFRDHVRACLDAGRATTVVVTGEPGTGRTELILAVGKEVDAAVYELRADPGQLLPSDRVRIDLSLAMRSPRAIVVIDEGSDPSPHLRRRRRGRGLPSMFDRSVSAREPRAPRRLAAVVVRIVGQLDEDDDSLEHAVLGAPDLVVRVGTLPPAARARAIARAAGFAENELPASLADAAARGAAPAAVGRAAAVVRGIGYADPAAAERALRHLVAPACTLSSLPPSPLRYDPAWIRTDIAVESLLAAVRRGPRGRCLFHGAPGTGKTALARKLAEHAGLEVVTRAGSELLSMWLGGTEKNIAAAFAEARASSAMLVLDEIESFLAPRTQAVRSWEVTQVNEMLVQIDRFDGWLVCTTNFGEGLDQAAMRRFPIKVQFSPPDARQRRALFGAAAAALGIAVTAEDDPAVERILARAELLTPGDVAAVVEHAEVVGGVTDAVALAERMLGEISYKRGQREKVGFA